jgi:hypothetical protein
MPYSQFTNLEKAVQQFELIVNETTEAIAQVTAATPSAFLQQALARELTWAIAVGTEKARSEAIILPILLEVREQLNRQISVFSGREFDVDESQGLSGYCDYLISQAPQQSVITVPVAVIVEAKKGDLTLGLGHCTAAMVAAQRFNQQRQHPLTQVYGAVSSGTLWQFLKLQGQVLTFDLNEYPIPPVDLVLAILLTISHSTT